MGQSGDLCKLPEKYGENANRGLHKITRKRGTRPGKIRAGPGRRDHDAGKIQEKYGKITCKLPWATLVGRDYEKFTGKLWNKSNKVSKGAGAEGARPPCLYLSYNFPVFVP